MVDRRTVLLSMATFAAVGTADAAAPDQTGASVDMPTERVLGIGGLFFRSHEPHKLAEWYQAHLGINLTPMDASHQPWQQTAGPTAFTPFSMTSGYLGPPQQSWMVNFRVRNLDAMVAQLRKSEIEVKVDPGTYPYGRFARLSDPEGNPIELWEPASPT